MNDQDNDIREQVNVSLREMQTFIPKYVWLREKLREVITQLPVGSALPTIAKLQEQYQVSRQTVDRAVQELRTEGWLKCRRGSGIYVTPHAKMVKVGVVSSFDITASGENRFYMLLRQQLQRVADAMHISMRYYFLDDQHHTQLANDIASRDINSLILLVLDAQSIAQYHVPYIGLGNDPGATNIAFDYGAIVRMAVEALAEQGCQRIALLHHLPNELKSLECATFAQAIADYGLETLEEWIDPLPAIGYSLQLAGEQFFQHLWSECAERPDGIVCVDDNATIGMLHAARMLEVSIPGAVRIVSHANRGADFYDSAPITRLEFDIEEIASAMLTLISDLTKGVVASDARVVIKPQRIDAIPSAN